MTEALYKLQEKFLDDHNILIQLYDYIEAPEGANRDAEMLKMLQEVEQHVEKFGHIFTYPKEIALIYDNPSGADGLGHFHVGSEVVTFIVPGSMKNLQNLIDDALSRKFFVARNAMEIITHEMAHHQHFLRRKELWPDMEKGVPPQSMKMLDEEFETLKGVITSDVSEYAATNAFEFVAEYSTLVIHQGKDGIYSDEIHDFFKKVS